MTTLDDLYVYYCRQHKCIANSGFRGQLRELYTKADSSRDITELSLAQNYLGPRGLLPVFDLIRNIHTLERVDLSGNGLDNDGVQVLVEACVRHPRLAHIDLSRNALHDACASLLIYLLKENTRITGLMLAGNNFSSGLREKIAYRLEENRAAPSQAYSQSAGLVPPRAAPYRAILEDYVTAAESGGSLSFEYSWRKNPQIRLAVSKASKVLITLTIAEPVATRLVGFTLLKTADARKALITDRTNRHFLQQMKHDQAFVPAKHIAETTYSETSCCLEVDLERSSCPCDAYVIVPYSFQPGKAFSFKLVAEVQPTIDCAAVTLEKVPPTDSWLLEEVEGAWTEQTSGGPMTCPSWRLNDMIRVRLDTNRCKSEPHRLRSAATFFILLSVQNEERTTAGDDVFDKKKQQPRKSITTSSSGGSKVDDDCDGAGAAAGSSSSSSATQQQLDIGCDVLLPESSEFSRGPRRPIRGLSPLLSFHHCNATTIVFALDTPCNDSELDFFIVPSTSSPGTLKSYRVAVYSNTAISTTISAPGADWCWRQVPEAQWDVETCGGGRKDNPTTWINNPCYKFTVPESTPVDALVIITPPGPVGMGSFKCVGTRNNVTSKRGGDVKASSNAAEFDFNVELDVADDTCKRLFPSSSTDEKNGGWTSSAQRCECSLWAHNLEPGDYWIIPQTRLPGVLAPFRLNIFSSSQIMFDGELPSPLSAILRKQQLARYDSINAERAARTSTSRSTSTTNNGTSTAISQQQQKQQQQQQQQQQQEKDSNNNTIQQVHENAVALYGSSGEMFKDRDFPRGPTSVWLNAEEKPLISMRSGVPDFPDVFEWSRLSEMVAAPMFSPLKADLSQMGVTPQGLDDSWFFSAACAVCAKRSLASSIVVHADFAVGIFQFRFFKHGRAHTVCVDDFVPLDGSGELCFAKSSHPDDLFFPLVEKAYAKLHRCYEALDAFNTSKSISNEPGTFAAGYAGSSLISQALADLTGGIPIERTLYDQEGVEWCNNNAGSKKSTSSINYSNQNKSTAAAKAAGGGGSLWSLLLDAHCEDVVVAVRCSASQPRANEKCAYSGLVVDRLYPVLEAIEEEGVRLVLLLNPFGWDAPVTSWRGKWALTTAMTSTATEDKKQRDNDNSNNNGWTDARRVAFDCASRPSNSFWVSYEELQYYFGVVHFVDLKCNTTRINCPLTRGGPPESVEWINNAQYGLNFVSSSSNNNNNINDNSGTTGRPQSHVVVTVGLHEEDRRMSINRANNATVDYSAHTRPPLRITVLDVPQNERRLAVLSTNSEQCSIMSSKPASQRDVYFSFVAEPDRKYIVMPCFDRPMPETASPPPPRLRCTLSATSSSPTIQPTLVEIEDDRVVSIDGEWSGTSAGGPPTYPEWRNNPQYLLYPSEDMMTVTVMLRQRNDTDSSADHIGFCILDLPNAATRVMHYPAGGSGSSGGGGGGGAIVAQASHENSQSVSVSVKLRSIAHRRGVPYVIVPSTSKPWVETGFTISAVANRPVQLKRLASEFDWKVVRRPSEKISVAGGTAGGSTKFSSWRNNPQYCCRFPVGHSGRLVVTMIKKGASSLSEEQIGIVCFFGEDFQCGKRKRLSYRAQDIAGIGASTSGSHAEIDVPFENCTTSLLVMPYSELPFSEVEFTLVFHSTVDVTVENAIEWNQYHQEAAWVAGASAGGPRHTHGWMNNPFYGIVASVPTRIFALIMQYPHGPEKLVARKVGRQRVYIAPPIVNDHLAVEFAADLCDSSEESLPVVTCSTPTRLAETSVSALIEPNGRVQHLLVPYTSTAGIEADFKIILYADNPIEFTALPPADPYRGRIFS